MEATTTRTRQVHTHVCTDAHRKVGQAPTAECATRCGGLSVTCGTETVTARQVRRFKSRPGQVKVTWSNGSATWEAE